MSDKNIKRISLAITGASGVQYGLRLLELLLKADCHVDVMISKAAQLVIATETDLALPGRSSAQQDFLRQHFNADERLRVFGKEDWMAPVASGSGKYQAMVICPCSTGTLSAVATGASNNLIERAADVALKERRQLIMLLREMPLSEIHLNNMLTLTRMGAVIMPASPGFYHKPQSVQDMVDFVVARILDQLGIDQQLVSRWGE